MRGKAWTKSGLQVFPCGCSKCLTTSNVGEHVRKLRVAPTTQCGQVLGHRQLLLQSEVGQVVRQQHLCPLVDVEKQLMPLLP